MSGEIQAAHITAQATISAAWIQGVLTLAAGAFAFVAGVFAYHGALKAASIQGQLERKKHEDRVAAYRFRIDALTDDLEGLAARCLSAATITLAYFRKDGGSYPIPVLPLYQVPDLSEEQWQNHALLGQLAVRAIYKLNLGLNQYISFQQEVVRGGLKSNQKSKHSLKTTTGNEKDDGPIEFTYTYTCAAEDNEILARNLQESIKELKSAIK